MYMTAQTEGKKAATLYYFHDPMCSWCWGYRPTWEKVESALCDDVVIEYCLGGLAPDSDTPMPADMALAIQSYWRKINAQLGTPFNFDFWHKCTPRRSTYPACRAVLAAKAQLQEREMIFVLQQAYYLRVLNPSDTSTHCQLATEIGLDPEKFASDLLSDEINNQLLAQIALSRKWQVPGFPSLVLLSCEQLIHIPVNYLAADETIDLIRKNLT